MAGTTRATRFRIGFLVWPLALAVFASGAWPNPSAFAQERRRSVLDMLFGTGGGSRSAEPPMRERRYLDPPPQPRKGTRKKADAERPAIKRPRKETRRTAPAERAKVAPAVVALPKNENARVVLVVGDFLAASLAKGLEDAVAENRDVRIVSKSEGSSGLVRQDHYDWTTALPALMDETKPGVVVVMLGINDRQAIEGPSGPLAARSPEWTAEYERRVDAIAGTVKKRNVPLVWVGQPPYESDRASADMAFLNDIDRGAVLAADGEFVDIWGGFADAGGNFTSSGPDTEGQPARLRNSDGITMTAAGQAKLAYFAEKPISKILGFNVEDLLVSLAPQQLSATQLPTIVNGANAVATAPIAFSDPALDGGDALLGGELGKPAASSSSPRDKLVMAGAAIRPEEGRADDFNWTGKSTAVSPVTQKNAIVARGSTSLDALRADPKAAPPKPEAVAPLGPASH